MEPAEFPRPSLAFAVLAVLVLALFAEWTSATPTAQTTAQARHTHLLIDVSAMGAIDRTVHATKHDALEADLRTMEPVAPAPALPTNVAKHTQHAARAI